jgi:hypothetical protein
MGTGHVASTITAEGVESKSEGINAKARYGIDPGQRVQYKGYHRREEYERTV